MEEKKRKICFVVSTLGTVRVFRDNHILMFKLIIDNE